MYVALIISVLAAVYIIYTVVTMRQRDQAGHFPKPPRKKRLPTEPKEVVNPEFQFDDPKPGENR